MKRTLHALVFCLALGVSASFAQYQSRTSSQSRVDCQTNPDNPVCVQDVGAASSLKGNAPTNEFPTTLQQLNPQVPDTSVSDRSPQVSGQNVPGLMLPQPPTEFQLLVEDAVGKALPIFGAELFRTPNTFSPLDRVPVPSDYVIGPGDEVYIRIWGQVNAELRLTVDRNGHVFIPKVGEIPVAGIRVSKLNDHFRTQIGRSFRNFDVTATLGRLRSIDVFLVGQVRRPGKYTVSSLSTLVNALFESGGPAVQGSLRRIQVKRSGQVVTNFDLYDLLLKGDTSQDVNLLPGDVIYVPPVGPQVAVSGSVNTPAIYELKDARASIGDVITLAGGLSSVADGTRVAVERIDERKTMSVAEFNLDDSGNAQAAKDGDIVRVYSIVPKYANAVTLRGNVANPGRYPWHPGMRIRDLIPNKELLLTRAFWTEQNGLVDGSATQYKSSRKKTPKSDTSIGEVEPNRSSRNRSAEETEQTGAETADAENSGTEARAERQRGSANELLRTSHESQRVDEIRLRNEVKLTAPEINWDYAAIQRLDPVDLSTTIIPFSLSKAILQNQDSDNIELKAGDVVTIFSQHDVSVPQNRQTQFVRIEGEVVSPGVYRVAAGETLRSVLERAGGLSANAYLYGTQLTRESARKEQQASLDRLAGILEGEIQQKASADAKSSPEDSAAIATRTESQRRLIDQLRGSKATGRVVLEMKPADSSINSLPEIALEDGDRVLIPARGATVSVVGAVYTQSSFLFRENSTVGHYLRQAGGGSSTSDTKHLLLVRADGSVIGRRSNGSMWAGGLTSVRVFPGDTIVVPTKLQSSGFSRALKDWTQVASQLAITAASLSIVSR